MDHRPYLIRLLLIAAVLLAATAAINIAVDPYNVFGSKRIAGFNENKPHAGDRGRTAKLHQVLRAQPRLVIVGNSRSEMGLDPEHACWPVQPVYNLAIPGLTLYKQVRYAQHAIAGSNIETVLLSVDFVDFLAKRATRQQAPFWPITTEAAAVSVTADGAPRKRWQLERQVDRFRASVSLEALTDALTTITAQRRNYVSTRTTNGFFPAEGLYTPIVNNEGVAVLFDQKNRQVAARMQRDLSLYTDSGEWSAEFETIERFLSSQRAAQRDTVLYINPYHAEYLLLLHARGLWPDFESWKRKLTEVAARFDVPVYDFALFDEHATEVVGSIATRGESLQWFWEPSHYRAELGNKMIARMFAAGCEQPHDNFGVQLQATTLDAHLAAVNAHRDAFVAAHPGVYDRLRALLETG